MEQIIAHIDMDCFFCACEEKYNPKLKGKPVIVGGRDGRGVVATANYEARKYGVHSAMPGSKAKMLCPNGIYLPSNHTMYRDESCEVMKILKKYTHNFEQVSIDEAYLDLTKFARRFNSLKEMGEYIKKEVFEKTKLTCSMGISSSRIVSKIASDYKKPSGITVVENQKLFLRNLPITKIPGIGKKSKEVYFKNGVHKIGDLVNKNKFFILDHFGKQGIKYQKLAMGMDKSKIQKRVGHKSYSRETTFSQNKYKPLELKTDLLALCDRVYTDLKGEYYKTVSIKIRYYDFTSITRDYSLKTPDNSLNKIKEKALELFFKNIDSEKSVRLIGVKLANLSGRKEKQTKLKQFFLKFT